MYQSFANVARTEGFSDIAYLFEEVANIERRHDYNFRRLAINIETGAVFCKQDENLWICINCGNIIRGTCAPLDCPVCGYPQSFYELYRINI